MKILVLIMLIGLLSGCMRTGGIYDGVVVIRGVRDGTELVRGMGVCIGQSHVLTSGHVVRDDRLIYEIGGVSYTGGVVRAEVTERDSESDTAYMRLIAEEGGVRNICKNYKKYTGKTDTLKVSEVVSIPVNRSGSITIFTGSITSLTGTVLAYDTLGRTQVFSGIILTDVVTLPGDSGAPILDGEGRVVDVVHVQMSEE